jgi:hypothetical protein
MAPGNLKMDILESPMREGDTPSSTEESKVESKNPLLTLEQNTSSVVAHTSSVHELLECLVCTNSMYPHIHQVPNLLFSLWVFFGGVLFFPSVYLSAQLIMLALWRKRRSIIVATTAPTHPISFFFLGTKTSRCRSRCDGRTYKKLQS